MKREYEKPKIVVVEIETEGMIAASVQSINDRGGLNDDNASRRGNWGDVWSK